MLQDVYGTGSPLAGRIGGTDGQAVEAMAKPDELVLARTYLCGVKDEEHIRLTNEPLEQVLSKYKGWEIISSEQGKLILLKRENDIAPACKANGYFGLSADGVLTLFNGVPGEQKVIQTFYQIDTAKMEAALPKEEVELLKKGIRVRDLSEYNSVLSTFSEFQTDETMPEGH
ncbi:BofC protein [Brevibacillus sp. SYP-B805]|nr:BofC protein [Brevibacillus sp. SYP-B805]